MAPGDLLFRLEITAQDPTVLHTFPLIRFKNIILIYA